VSGLSCNNHNSQETHAELPRALITVSHEFFVFGNFLDNTTSGDSQRLLEIFP
jgi:hypothetical protein